MVNQPSSRCESVLCGFGVARKGFELVLADWPRQLGSSYNNSLGTPTVTHPLRKHGY